MGPDITISADGDDPVAEARQALSMIDTDETDIGSVEVTVTPETPTTDGGSVAQEASGGQQPEPSEDIDQDEIDSVHVKPGTDQHAVLLGLSAGDYRDYSMVAELSPADIEPERVSDILSHWYNDETRRKLIKRRKAGRGYDYLLSALGREYRDSMPEVEFRD